MLLLLLLKRLLLLHLLLSLHRHRSIRAATHTRITPDDHGALHRVVAASTVLTHAALDVAVGLAALEVGLPGVRALHVHHPLQVGVAFGGGLAALAAVPGWWGPVGTFGLVVGRLQGVGEGDEGEGVYAVILGYFAADEVVLLGGGVS